MALIPNYSGKVIDGKVVAPVPGVDPRYYHSVIQLEVEKVVYARDAKTGDTITLYFSKYTTEVPQIGDSINVVAFPIGRLNEYECESWTKLPEREEQNEQGNLL